MPYGAQGVGNYMKMQGLDVGDEKRFGGEAWWLSCGVLSNSLVYIMDTYQSKMDVSDARTNFLAGCPVRIVRSNGISGRPRIPCANPAGEAPSRPSRVTKGADEGEPMLYWYRTDEVVVCP